MPTPLSINIIYNKQNTYGLKDDVQLLERVFKTLSGKRTIHPPKLLDAREPLSPCDLQIHLEIPIYGAIPWAHANVILVNPEHWSYAFDEYIHAFDALLFRDATSAEQFRSDFKSKGLRTDNIYVIPWVTSWHKDLMDKYIDKKKEFVCFLGASTNKYEYMKMVLGAWLQSDPPLTVYTVRNDFASMLSALDLPSNVTIICKELNDGERFAIMSEYSGHIICSAGEAYGYSAAHAEAAGAFSIMNALPVFSELYSSDEIDCGVAWLTNTYTLSEKVRYHHAQPTHKLRSELDAAFTQFYETNHKEIYRKRRNFVTLRFSKLCDVFHTILSSLEQLIFKRKPQKGLLHFPPILEPKYCPPISIITPTFHRKHLIDIAFYNILITDYPHDKIEWIVIEDYEKPSQNASEKIISFQVQCPEIKLKYIPIEGRMSIGEKRNIAVDKASHDIILFMDDDDHYPSTSFRRRVAWLTKGIKNNGNVRIVCCTTIALYDLRYGTSAVNVPPFDIPLSQRISEATLTFYKSVWNERSFHHVSIAEGENWITGREDQVLEIPAQQIIVAFSHGTNQSDRRIPPSCLTPSCFWGFSKEYLIFIHKLAGVDIDDSIRVKK